MAARKSAAKKSAAKKAAPKKATAKKAAAKKTAAKKGAPQKATTKRGLTAQASAPDAGLTSLLSKIHLELDNGKRRKMNSADIKKAQECLAKNGRIVLSFKPATFEGTGSGGTGNGTNIID